MVIMMKAMRITMNRRKRRRAKMRRKTRKRMRTGVQVLAWSRR